jgi:hypothetical protein
VEFLPPKPAFQETKPAYTSSSIAMAAPKSAKNGVGILNLKAAHDHVHRKRQLEAIDSEAVVKADEAVFERVNEERFLDAWKGYIQNLKERGKLSMASMANKCQPSFTPEGGVIIKVDNVSLKSHFLEDKTAFNDLMNTRFHISNVRIDFEVEAPTETEMKRYLVSDTDKFRRLIELNPAVLDMQKRLGLIVE